MWVLRGESHRGDPADGRRVGRRASSVTLGPRARPNPAGRTLLDEFSPTSTNGGSPDTRGIEVLAATTTLTPETTGSREDCAWNELEGERRCD